MESRPIYDYIFLGTALRYLESCQPGSPVRDIDGTGPYVLEHLALFLAELDRFGLRVTAESAWKLRELQVELESNESETLTADEAQRLHEAMRLVRHTLEAEAQMTRAFVVTEKRIEVDKLLGDVGALMPPSIFAKTSALAQHDLSAAGRAIAFELPTAAAFHALRATEDVLRQFYRYVIRQGRLKNLLWGPMVDQMRKKKTKRPDDALLDVLDRIRINFRNPTDHPDYIFDIQEAQELFLACIEAIARMTRSPLWKP